MTTPVADQHCVMCKICITKCSNIITLDAWEHWLARIVWWKSVSGLFTDSTKMIKPDGVVLLHFVIRSCDKTWCHNSLLFGV